MTHGSMKLILIHSNVLQTIGRTGLTALAPAPDLRLAAVFAMMLPPEVSAPVTQGIDILAIVSRCLLLLPAGGERYRLELVYVRSWIIVDLVTMRCRRGQGSALAGFTSGTPHGCGWKGVMV